MAVHYGDKGRGLYGALNVREDVDVGGDVNVTGDVNAGDVNAGDVLIGTSRMQRNVMLDLADDGGNGGGFSWAVPGACIINSVLVNIVEAPHAAGRTLDVGVTDTAAAREDNIIDGLGLGTTDGRVYTSISAHGTNGRGMYVADAGQFVTGTNSSALTGNPDIRVHIFYTLL